MRLFVAILPPETIRQRLLCAQQALAQQGRGRFVPAENLHLTLAFLGETERLRAAEDALHMVQSAPILLRLSGVGCFGDLYWAGMERSDELDDLYQQLCRALRGVGFVLERRAFRPHWTLCRSFHPAEAFDPSAASRALGMPQFCADRISLMRSVRGDGGMIYTEVAVQPLL